MRYCLETFIEKNSEYVKIIPLTTDFENFLSYRLKVFPLYLASTEVERWFSKKIVPDILDKNLPGSQKLIPNVPLLIQKDLHITTKHKERYREQLLNLLTEWLQENVYDFQNQWRLSVKNKKEEA